MTQDMLFLATDVLADLKDMTQDMLSLAKDVPADLKDMTQYMLSLAKDVSADLKDLLSLSKRSPWLTFRTRCKTGCPP